MSERSVVLGIGSANSAGQGWAWGRAAETWLPGVRSHVIAVQNGIYDFPADEPVPRLVYAHDVNWQLRARADAFVGWTHAIVEAGRPMFGALQGTDMRADVESLVKAGVKVGLVFHGSEVRDPRRHALTDRYSPFTDPLEPRTKALQRSCDRVSEVLAALEAHHGQLPRFVSTPDQLAYVAGATWLPVTVATALWSSTRAPFDHLGLPLVVHAPSTPWLKGTPVIDRVLSQLARDGRIEYRQVTGMPPAEAARLVLAADVVVDQLLLGLYGVLAVEAMASGRVVVGHLGTDLRSRVPAEVPIVEATPDNLGEVVTALLDDRDAALSSAAAGPGFVAQFHDGQAAARVLSGFLGVELNIPPTDIRRSNG